MKKILSLLMAALLLLGLCACGEAAEPLPAEPIVTAAPAATPAPTEAPTPEPTEAPTPSPTPFPYVKGEETISYTLMPTAGMGDGAKALMYWLLGDGMLMAQSFRAKELGEPMFSLPANPVTNSIAYAAEETRSVTLATDSFMADCGLLQELLAAFEKDYGYSVELYIGDAETIEGYLRAGLCELVLAAGEAGNHLRDRKLVNARHPFVTTEYVPAE